MTIIKREENIRKKKSTKSRMFLAAALVLDMLLIALLTMDYVNRTIPDKLTLFAGSDDIFEFRLPAVVEPETEGEEVVQTISGLSKSNGSGDVKLIPGTVPGKCRASVKLFGIITVKHIEVNVIEEEKIMPCALPVGIYLETDGLLVLGTAHVANENGIKYEPSKNIIKEDDYIMSVNGQKVVTKQQMIDLIQESESEYVLLRLRRDNEFINVRVRKVKDSDGVWHIGAFVRNDMQGLGTMTYVKENGSFAALGHGVNDVDTNALMDIGQGSIYTSTMTDVVKGKRGVPGQIVGRVNYGDDERLGEIESNRNNGIYGNLSNEGYNRIINGKILENNSRYAGRFLKVGLKQNIHAGKAYIVSCIDHTLRDYSIDIEEVNINDDGNKGLVIRVTDDRLLELSGGIIRGLSGSPIIQNGRLIGAVTHVMVNDPQRGYGITIENMLG